MTSPDTSPEITLEEQFHFDTHGYVMLRGALSPDEVARYLEAIERLEKQTFDDSWLEAPEMEGQHGMTTLNDDGTQRRLNGLPRIDDTFDDLIVHPAMLARLKAFMDHPQIVNTWSISKDIGNGWGGWHAGVDPRHYSFRGGRISTEMLNTVIFLTDNGPDDGCVCVVPGSHKANVRLNPGDYFGKMMPGAIEVTGKAGDILMFSECVLHTGNAKTTSGTRTNLYFNYINGTYNPAMREVLGRNIGCIHHYVFPPEVRARFSEEALKMTEWMEWMRDSPLSTTQTV